MNTHATKIHIEADIPEQLARSAQVLVEDGWAPNLNSLVVEALRRYCETHQAVLTESYLREDLRWGLHGDD